jgi:hypothetical protein
MVDDRRVLSCLTLVATLEGRNVITIEDMSLADGTLHPMQQAFIDHDAFQCGYSRANGSNDRSRTAFRAGRIESPPDRRNDDRQFCWSGRSASLTPSLNR